MPPKMHGKLGGTFVGYRRNMVTDYAIEACRRRTWMFACFASLTMCVYLGLRLAKARMEIMELTGYWIR